MVQSKSTYGQHFSLFMYPSEVCTSPMFILVRHLSQSDVCTSPTFVSPTFVLSNLRSVRRLYWYSKILEIKISSSEEPVNFCVAKQLFCSVKKKLIKCAGKHYKQTFVIYLFKLVVIYRRCRVQFDLHPAQVLVQLDNTDHS